MKASFSIEGMHRQADDLDLQRRYIEGQISLDNMLEHARDCAHRHGQAGSL